MLGFCPLSPFAGLPVAGQRAIAILLFAVIFWVSEAMDITVSTVWIAVAIILLIGSAPDLADPGKIVCIARAWDWATLGFANTSVVRVGAALVFAAAQNATMLGLPQHAPDHSVTWIDWFVAALPFWLIMAPVLYLLLWRMHRPEIDHIEGGAENIRARIA